MYDYNYHGRRKPALINGAVKLLQWGMNALVTITLTALVGLMLLL